MRAVLTLLFALVLAASAGAADVRDGAPLAFPRDHGAHPAFRTEWWYVTGWLTTADGDSLGFQVTFFRSRLPVDDANPSRFAPRQLLFAHAALADPKVGRLVHDERIARTGLGIADASESDAAVVLDRWRFERVGGPEALRFRTRVDGDRFTLDLDLDGRGPVLAQGADATRPGYSQKGPDEGDASRYYSVPQLSVSGSIARGGGRPPVRVTGTAWLDREWSNAYLDRRAVGWDWVGLNLDDGGALMAFQMRERAGGKLWAGGARRFPDGRIERYRPDAVDFTPLRTWASKASGATWPVMQKLVIAGASVTPLSLVIEPVMDDQELDSRASTGTIYWEGAVRVRGESGAPAGRGYLELTGYHRPIRF